MKWNNTLVTLLISGLQVNVFTGLHEISCMVRNISIAIGSNYFAEPMHMKLFSSPFRECRGLFYQKECCLSALFPINPESLFASSYPPALWR